MEMLAPNLMASVTGAYPVAGGLSALRRILRLME
jgi:hypothetical protein